MMRKKVRTGGLGPILIGVLVLWGCDPSADASEASAVAAQEEFVRVVNVEVERLEPADFTAYIRITGEVEAMNDVTISAEESGVITRFHREKGEVVGAGEPLAKIDDRVLRAQVAEAEAQARLAAERFERRRRLWEGQRIGTEIDYLEARYEADLAAARLESLRARLDRTLIRSPIPGVFDTRYVDAGEMVAPGTRVARVVEVERLKVTGGVPERHAGRVSVADSARVTFDLFPDREFVGRIRYVGAAIEPGSRTFPIEVLMENPNRLVKPQMVANMEIAAERLTNVIVVPQQAVVRTEDGYQVFVVEEWEGGPVARPRPVRLGPSARNRTVVHEGLEAGDRLIVQGQKMVDPGDRVRIVKGGDATT